MKGPVALGLGLVEEVPHLEVRLMQVMVVLQEGLIMEVLQGRTQEDPLEVLILATRLAALILVVPQEVMMVTEALTQGALQGRIQEELIQEARLAALILVVPLEQTQAILQMVTIHAHLAEVRQTALQVPVELVQQALIPDHQTEKTLPVRITAHPEVTLQEAQQTEIQALPEPEGVPLMAITTLDHLVGLILVQQEEIRMEVPQAPGAVHLVATTLVLLTVIQGPLAAGRQVAHQVRRMDLQVEGTQVLLVGPPRTRIMGLMEVQMDLLMVTAIQESLLGAPIQEVHQERTQVEILPGPQAIIRVVPLARILTRREVPLLVHLEIMMGVLEVRTQEVHQAPILEALLEVRIQGALRATREAPIQEVLRVRMLEAPQGLIMVPLEQTQAVLPAGVTQTRLEVQILIRPAATLQGPQTVTQGHLERTVVLRAGILLGRQEGQIQEVPRAPVQELEIIREDLQERMAALPMEPPLVPQGITLVRQMGAILMPQVARTQEALQARTQEAHLEGQTATPLEPTQVVPQMEITILDHQARIQIHLEIITLVHRALERVMAQIRIMAHQEGLITLVGLITEALLIRIADHPGIIQALQMGRIQTPREVGRIQDHLEALLQEIRAPIQTGALQAQTVDRQEATPAEGPHQPMEATLGTTQAGPGPLLAGTTEMGLHHAPGMVEAAPQEAKVVEDLDLRPMMETALEEEPQRIQTAMVLLLEVRLVVRLIMAPLMAPLMALQAVHQVEVVEIPLELEPTAQAPRQAQEEEALILTGQQTVPGPPMEVVMEILVLHQTLEEMAQEAVLRILATLVQGLRLEAAEMALIPGLRMETEQQTDQEDHRVIVEAQGLVHHLGMEGQATAQELHLEVELAQVQALRLEMEAQTARALKLVQTQEDLLLAEQEEEVVLPLEQGVALLAKEVIPTLKMETQVHLDQLEMGALEQKTAPLVVPRQVVMETAEGTNQVAPQERGRVTQESPRVATTVDLSPQATEVEAVTEVRIIQEIQVVQATMETADLEALEQGQTLKQKRNQTPTQAATQKSLYQAIQPLLKPTTLRHQKQLEEQKETITEVLHPKMNSLQRLQGALMTIWCPHQPQRSKWSTTPTRC